jgi:hypothetical protein
MIPDDGESEDVVEELLKNPQYVRRDRGKVVPQEPLKIGEG